MQSPEPARGLIKLARAAFTDGRVVPYGKRIGDLAKDRMIIGERIEKSGMPLATYEETFEHSMTFLASTWKYLKNGNN